MIDGHILKVTDDHRLLVNGQDLTGEFIHEPTDMATYHKAVEFYKQNF
jgi:hypothetical protein